MKLIKETGVFLSSILLFLTCLFLTISFILKISIRPSSIQKYINENDFSFLVKTSSGDDSLFLKETKMFLEGLGISGSVVDQVIESDVVKQLIRDYTIQYILYYLNEGEKPVFDASLFKKILRENTQITSWLFKSISKQEKEQKQKLIDEKIDEYSKDVLNFFPTVQHFMQRLESEKSYFGVTIPQILDFIAFLMSKFWILLSIILLWISMILLFCCGKNVRSVYKALYRTSFAYTSVLIVVEIFLGTVVKTALMNRLEIANGFINYMVNVISKDIWVFVIVGIFCSIFFYHYPKWIYPKKSLTSS